MSHKLLIAIGVVWRKRFGVLPLRESLEPLSRWFGSPLGRLLIEREQALIDAQLYNLFGYHLLQLGVAEQLDLTRASRISHRFALYPKPSCHAFISARADFNHLPLSANSIDVVLLHHVLDYSQSPHQVLREAARVLIAQGHVVVVGFNPWSFLGLWRWWVQWFSPAAQWRHQSLSLGRVLDWLALLDMEPVSITQGFYSPPCHQPSSIKYLQWLERWGKRLALSWGGCYVIVARKDSLAVTPLKPQWQGYAGLRGWGVTKILGRAIRDKAPQAHCKANE